MEDQNNNIELNTNQQNQPIDEVLIHEINVNQQMPDGISEVNDFFETLEKIREHQQMIELNGSANDTEMENEENEESENSSSSEEEKKSKKSKKDKKKKDKKKKDKKEKDKKKDKKEKEKEKKPKKKDEKEKKQKKAKKLTKDQIIKGIKNGELVIVESDQYEKLLRTANKLQKISFCFHFFCSFLF